MTLEAETVHDVPAQRMLVVAHQSIEFFHVYSDDELGPANDLEIGVLKDTLASADDETSVVVLIDNYNSQHHRLGHDDIIDYLEDRRVRIDGWAYEADLVPTAARLLPHLAKDDRRDHSRFYQARGKYACSLLTAAWYLTRLGAMDAEGVVQVHDGCDLPPTASALVNILPVTYREVEDRAVALVRNSSFSELAGLIRAIYVETEVCRPDFQ